jgi:hypothetical protein
VSSLRGSNFSSCITAVLISISPVATSAVRSLRVRALRRILNCCLVAAAGTRILTALKIIATANTLGPRQLEVGIGSNTVLAGSEGSTPLIPKPATAHDSEPLPSTSDSQKLSNCRSNGGCAIVNLSIFVGHCAYCEVYLMYTTFR